MKIILYLISDFIPCLISLIIFGIIIYLSKTKKVNNNKNNAILDELTSKTLATSVENDFEYPIRLILDYCSSNINEDFL